MNIEERSHTEWEKCLHNHRWKNSRDLRVEMKQVNWTRTNLGASVMSVWCWERWVSSKPVLLSRDIFHLGHCYQINSLAKLCISALLWRQSHWKSQIATDIIKNLVNVSKCCDLGPHKYRRQIDMSKPNPKITPPKVFHL